MRRLKNKHVIVVGAGIGGLVTALDLISRGFEVTVFERSAQPGGKMREINVQGRLIDAGPTVLTMPWVFEELFSAAGSALHEHVELKAADVLARHAWRDGTQLDLFADLDQSADAIAQFADQNESDRYRAFCQRANQVFDTLYQPFIRSQRPSVFSLVAASGLRGLGDLWRIQPFETLWRRLGKSFRDPRLRMLFARYATYCGSSPLQAPATLMLIAHVERRGVWQVTGGMQRLAEALANLIQLKGGTINYQSCIERIDVKRSCAQGVVLGSGEHVRADAVVANTDGQSIQRGLLGDEARTSGAKLHLSKRSLSALTWSLVAESSGFELDHHNVFFPDEYPQEFIDIFKHRRLPTNPAVYVCAQDRGPGRVTPDGPERLFIIVNAPPTGDQHQFLGPEIEPTQTAAFKLLDHCGLSIDRQPDHCIVTTPADFEARFQGTGGALYGSSAHGWRSSFTRPGARCRVRGLYLTGGSIHPGPGVPMVAVSGRLAAQAVADDLGR